jgi:hypothetical protein
MGGAVLDPIGRAGSALYLVLNVPRGSFSIDGGAIRKALAGSKGPNAGARSLRLQKNTKHVGQAWTMGSEILVRNNVIIIGYI